MYEGLINNLHRAADKWEKEHPIIGVGQLRVHDAIRDAARALKEADSKLEQVTLERDAAVADLKDCVTEAAQGDDFDCCFACKYNNEYGGCDRPNYTIEACGVEDFDNKWTWRGVQKGECDV